MQSHGSEPGISGDKHRIPIPIIALTLLGVMLALARLGAYHEPFERDLAGYAVIAHEVLHGRSMYTEVAEHKPPGPLFAYALAEILVGYGDQQMYFLGVVSAILTMIGLYCAGLWATDDWRIGLWAAAIWIVLSGDPSLQANQPNTEVFINSCMTWVFALLLGLRGSGLNRRSLCDSDSSTSLVGGPCKLRGDLGSVRVRGKSWPTV